MLWTTANWRGKMNGGAHLGSCTHTLSHYGSTPVEMASLLRQQRNAARLILLLYKEEKEKQALSLSHFVSSYDHRSGNFALLHLYYNNANSCGKLAFDPTRLVTNTTVRLLKSAVNSRASVRKQIGWQALPSWYSLWGSRFHLTPHVPG